MDRQDWCAIILVTIILVLGTVGPIAGLIWDMCHGGVR